MADEVAEFYGRHCAHPSGVVVVTVFDACGEQEQIAVFSSREEACAWTDSLEDDRQCLFVPYVIDAPEFGNVPPCEQN